MLPQDENTELHSKLSHLKEVLGAITDMMPDRHFVVDEDGLILKRFGNIKVDQFYQMYEPNSVQELTTPENVKQTMIQIGECLATQNVVTFEVSSKLSDIQKVKPEVTGPTSTQWFEVRMMPLSFVIEQKKTLIVSIRNITESKAAEQQLQELVITDPLTQLYNRRYANEELTRCLQRFLRYKTPITIMMLDIDFFKMINDTYGHDAGDLVLVELSKFLQDNIRKSDTIARIGGEEFLLIMPDVALKYVKPFCQRLVSNIEKFHIPIAGGNLTLTMSGGLTEFTASDIDVETVLKRADLALYRSKNEGRNRITIT
ncbi:GGDEF domain-containing protein [Psychromonas marina]|uniref:diguanylate cyclase n=1 Tax=Psychromonas marina TaxID=88364 RepID=A0ABQ6E1W4_9GAMM|nr:GGDEF domain-containing protein [Psychromonas marina]GLS91208.1 GGDEF domain-containing protein [Psychromonas marina]